MAPAKNIDFSNLSVLIVDDFSSFRKTVASLLTRLGVKTIEEAGRPSEMLKWCQTRTFDLILCDYNLGTKRNGQNLLEELHHRGVMRAKTLFVMVTAENSKELFLSAYDCKPADYLIKPINLQILETRLRRLINDRDASLEAQELLEEGLDDAAMAVFLSIIEKGGRGSSMAQKRLSEVYIKNRMWEEAKSLLTGIAAERDIDWVELGLAQVAMGEADYESAETRLLMLLKNSPNYLPAHDALTTLYQKQNKERALFDHLRGVIELCPSVIGRQRKLAQAAEKRGETIVQLRASYAAAKLGEASCYRDFDDVRSFVAAAGDVRESHIDHDVSDLLKESGRLLQQAQQIYKMDSGQRALSEFLEARMLYLSGDNETAQRTFSDAQRHLEQVKDRDIHIDLAKYQCMVSAGQVQAADHFLNSIVPLHEKDDEAMTLLDKYLPEPVSSANKSRIIEINREGIRFYQEENYEEAVECFAEAVKAFPRHAGLHLNYLQSLTGSLRKTPNNESKIKSLKDLMSTTQNLLPEGDKAKQDRFIQLAARAKKLLG